MLLNIDAGELADEPAELWRLADIVNVACGGHAGDEESMARVVDGVHGARTRVGAHPSYLDREGFGRRSLEVDVLTLSRQVAQQCWLLEAIARERGAAIAAVKPHGALYWDAAASVAKAAAIVAEAQRLGAAVIGPARGVLRDVAGARGVAYWREGFADRALRADGSLVPRTEPGALVTDPAACAVRAGELVASGDVETICVHGDTPGALAIARAVREVLDRAAAPPR
nr:LamB/YcsF family protein [Kofleriaceae bacterium]